MASKPRSTMTIRNRQEICAIDTKLFRQVVTTFVKGIETIDGYELGLHLVDASEMARVNEQFLNHEGSTDVITFDHQEDPESDRLYGELYLCLADAVKQARQFRTSWQSELTRYAIHGILHLCGYDDLTDQDRKEMKLAENRCLRKLAAEFNLAALELKDR